jgi:hypothetical protein
MKNTAASIKSRLLKLSRNENIVFQLLNEVSYKKYFIKKSKLSSTI